MLIKCLYCGEVIETMEELVNGQHIICPFCNKKFAYGGNACAHKTGVQYARLASSPDLVPGTIKILRVFAHVLMGLAVFAFITAIVGFFLEGPTRSAGSTWRWAQGALFFAILIFMLTGIWKSSEKTRQVLERIEKVLS